MNKLSILLLTVVFVSNPYISANPDLSNEIKEEVIDTKVTSDLSDDKAVETKTVDAATSIDALKCSQLDFEVKITANNADEEERRKALDLIKDSFIALAEKLAEETPNIHGSVTLTKVVLDEEYAQEFKAQHDVLKDENLDQKLVEDVA
jgi:hypothetical protein